ncbi:MAG: bifunctional phosphoribosyl-AMP cyclohydrolase/phosphoribosyl-ATP diphosphatase HisIE [Clostridia bacterium]|nr:bifunctional phosphoribosyl-AMP cyclohydrolase/phosphoribosyl-ATP diphosphatase HisIE [Clostridia bacterium]
MEFLNTLKFNAHGLIPAIVQDYANNEVLMMAYMNREAVEKTLETGKTWFWSRSRQKLWNKGETSGHWQLVKSMAYDCDADALLIKVEQLGVACHTGNRTCFHNHIETVQGEKTVPVDSTILDTVYQVILSRKAERPEGSYTTYLFDKGIDKILKKVGEEAAEVIIASKGANRDEVVYEAADLFFHTLVMLGFHDITPEEVYRELAKRR